MFREGPVKRRSVCVGNQVYSRVTVTHAQIEIWTHAKPRFLGNSFNSLRLRSSFLGDGGRGGGDVLGPRRIGGQSDRPWLTGRTTGLQDYRNTGLEDYRTTGLQDYRTTGIQD